MTTWAAMFRGRGQTLLYGHMGCNMYDRYHHIRMVHVAQHIFGFLLWECGHTGHNREWTLHNTLTTYTDHLISYWCGPIISCIYIYTYNHKIYRTHREICMHYSIWLLEKWSVYYLDLTQICLIVSPSCLDNSMINFFTEFCDDIGQIFIKIPSLL